MANIKGPAIPEDTFEMTGSGAEPEVVQPESRACIGGARYQQYWGANKQKRPHQRPFLDGGWAGTRPKILCITI